uniref:testis-expressed protein 47 n=1 Tax=Myxine glutinosa TaxID=7769 RepID=UPI00358E62F8
MPPCTLVGFFLLLDTIPPCSLSCFIYSLVKFKPLVYNKVYEYPPWAQTLGWCMALSSMLCVLIYAFLHLLLAEGSFHMCNKDIQYAVLRDLQEMEEQNKPLLEDVRVVVLSHNIPQRLFRCWNIQPFHVDASHWKTEQEEQETVQKLSAEAISILLRLGAQLGHHSKVEFKSALESLCKQKPELVIPREMLSALLCCGDLLRPTQFLRMYDRPVDVNMDLENVGMAAVHLLHMV